LYLYAKTNIQFYNQLLSGGYSKADLKFISDSYKLAQQLFSFHYRPSGDPFISHLVGTASILTLLHKPVKLITAGLLHAAYIHGEFGKISINPINNSKREIVRGIVGEETEKYIYKYTLLKWNSKFIPDYLEQLKKYDDTDRNVLLIRLVNEMEDNSNLTPLYCPDQLQRINYLKNSGPLIIDIAKQLGYPDLALELSEVFGKVISIKIPGKFNNPDGSKRVYRIVPKSYHNSLLHSAFKPVRKGIRFYNKLIHR
jgi:(p)ppGpp synthase/HD superfamily hydrolase